MSVDSSEDIIRELFGDLEWALSNELELFEEPSSYLVETVHERAVSLHEKGILSDDALDFSMSITHPYMDASDCDCEYESEEG